MVVWFHSKQIENNLLNGLQQHDPKLYFQKINGLNRDYFKQTKTFKTIT